METWTNTLLRENDAGTIWVISPEKPLDSRVLHSPFRCSLQCSCTSTCFIATASVRFVIIFANVKSVSLVESVGFPVDGLGSAWSVNVTQNRYKRSRQITGTKWSPSISALTGSQGVHIWWA